MYEKGGIVQISRKNPLAQCRVFDNLHNWASPKVSEAGSQQANNNYFSFGLPDFQIIMNYNLSDIFFIVVIFQLLFISLFLFTNTKGKKIGNILLGTFFLSVSLNLVDSFLVLKKVYIQNPSLVGWGICLPLLFGPLLYLYTQSVLYKDFRLSARRWIHLFPFLLFFIVSESRFLLLSREIQLSILQHVVDRKIPVVFYWSSGLIFLQFFLYIAASLRLINRYKKIASDKFSDQQRINVSWLFSTIIFFTCCMIIAVGNGFIGLTPFARYYYFVLTIIILLMFVFINRVLLKALKRPEIFSGIKEEEWTQPANGHIAPKYQGSTLIEEDKKRIADQILQHMQTSKPYLEPELTLEQLAGQLSLRPRILSRVINESMQQTFFDFINRYRIEEAKRLLTNPKDKKITVLEVLYEVGFNSKSSFNTLFKKHTGLTPSEFKKKHLQ